MRVNVAIPDDLLKKLDEAASSISISRSAYISIAVSQKIQQDSMMQDLPRLLRAYEETRMEALKNADEG